MELKEQVETNFKKFIENIGTQNLHKCLEISNWIGKQVELSRQSAYNNINKHKNPKNYHPVRPCRGWIYVVNYGCNVGFEFNDIHLGLIMQNDVGNTYRDTTIVLPITEIKTTEKFDKHVNIELTNADIINKVRNGLDKDPSKLKVESIISIDKSRLGVKVGQLTSDKMEEVENLLKNLINLS